MAKKKNKIKYLSAPDYPPPYYPGKIFHQDEAPNATPVSQLLKQPPYDPVKIFIVPVRVSIIDLLSQRALDIAIALTFCAAAIWLAAYFYLRMNP